MTAAAGRVAALPHATLVALPKAELHVHLEGAWNLVIRARQLGLMTPMLEAVLSRVTRREHESPDHAPASAAIMRT